MKRTSFHQLLSKYEFLIEFCLVTVKKWNVGAVSLFKAKIQTIKLGKFYLHSQILEKNKPIAFMSVRLSSCSIFGSHWPSIRGILYFGLVLNSVNKIQFCIKSDCNIGYFARRRVSQTYRAMYLNTTKQNLLWSFLGKLCNTRLFSFVFVFTDHSNSVSDNWYYSSGISCSRLLEVDKSECKDPKTPQFFT